MQKVGSAFEIQFLGQIIELYNFLGIERLENCLGGWRCWKTFIALYDFQWCRMIYFRKTLNVWIIFNHVWLSLLLFWFRQKHQARGQNSHQLVLVLDFPQEILVHFWLTHHWKLNTQGEGKMVYLVTLPVIEILLEEKQFNNSCN